MSGDVVSLNRQPTTSTRWRPLTSGVTFSAACAVPAAPPASATVASAPAAPARTNLFNVGNVGSMRPFRDWIRGRPARYGRAESGPTASEQLRARHLTSTCPGRAQRASSLPRPLRPVDRHDPDRDDALLACLARKPLLRRS